MPLSREAKDAKRKVLGSFLTVRLVEHVGLEELSEVLGPIVNAAEHLSKERLLIRFKSSRGQSRQLRDPMHLAERPCGR